ncbi:hypothetical protein SPRG_12856 [Saprolegnia parasitica CBS 223.65]|uniref:START domain-containing protein n=1 Tax=Saprolegnia parasitica (strain CBS 223.65) TaxID=695850 RepID=A0A067C595_SAPPC|nr:hypothetical protein SPRG_12856 [Saprolegnia parasitica CBS 223.65]KDO21997.1 hypothetical protein SPRG_12856 [Saprolegnia parasitica CBS 223.65]|eukprot:XP_012207330.1 hypothetical protein SPRG_12856 [Saprolegnia parasitica CBS 223.65]
MNELTFTEEMEILEIIQGHSASMGFLSTFLSTDPLPPPAAAIAPAKPPRRARTNPKAEIEYLRTKEKSLRRQLKHMHENQAKQAISSAWKGRAIQQARCAQRAMLENNRLKEAVETQLQFVEAFERVLEKQPKLSTFSTTHGHALWKQAVLSTSSRESDLELLLQGQRDKLESAWIRHRLHDAIAQRETVQKTFVDYSADVGMRISFVRGGLIPLSLDEMSDLLWTHVTTPLDASCSLLQTFHSDLVYTRQDIKLADPAIPILETRAAIRRYKEDGRTVMVWRSIVDDHLLPHEEGHLIDNRVTWVTLHPVDAHQCYISSHAVILTPLFPANVPERQPAIGSWTELLLRASDELTEKFSAALFAAVMSRQIALQA